MSDNVKVRPPGSGWVWVEEFGGGEWQRLPQKPTEKLDGARAVLNSMLYGPGYQGPPPSRSTTGVWTHYPGL